MHLGQVKTEGGVFAAIFEHGMARPIPHHTMLDLLRRAEAEDEPVTRLAAQLASHHPEPLAPILSIHAPEVWGCGGSYEAVAKSRDAEYSTQQGMYGYVYRGARPEIFFKGTARMCVAAGQPIGIRADSKFTAPEPELAVLLGSRGRILGYTLANDVSARDIECENALYLPQSKIFDGCCALGPYILMAEAGIDPYRLEISCSVERSGRVVFQGSFSTASLHRQLDSLIGFLTRSNRVPRGSVLMTGTGLAVPQEAALAAGDIVTIRSPEIGTLTNPAVVV